MLFLFFLSLFIPFVLGQGDDADSSMLKFTLNFSNFIVGTYIPIVIVVVLFLIAAFGLLWLWYRNNRVEHRSKQVKVI